MASAIVETVTPPLVHAATKLGATLYDHLSTREALRRGKQSIDEATETLEVTHETLDSAVARELLEEGNM